MPVSLAVMFLCLTFGPPAAPPTIAQGANTPRIHARPYLEYGNICWENERALLDTFAFVLASDPDAIGYITVYDGKLSCRREAEARALRARNYLVNFRRIEWNRVAWRYGGHRQEFTMFAHLFPRGMPPLEPELTVGVSESKEGCGAKARRRPKCPAR
ncbi:MAG TPA: hypothetical protein VG148_08870 [Pyrinomonadaceae bacterium]|nr:hypothetical protein [Pyrinomonadaceae bacterium]